MPYINVGQENSGNINLYYEDHGTGRTSRCVTHNSGPSEEGTPRSPSHFQVRSEPIKKEHASYRPRIVSLRRLLWQRADLRDRRPGWPLRLVRPSAVGAKLGDTSRRTLSQPAQELHSAWKPLLEATQQWLRNVLVLTVLPPSTCGNLLSHMQRASS